jgi:MFS family permease
LTAGGGVINSMLQRQGGIGACTKDAITLVAFIGSMYLAGRLAEHRGRRFKVWAGIAGIIGPLALPLVFLLPNLQDESGDRA